MKKTFTKQDLRDGMVIEYRDGYKALFLKDIFIGVNDWMSINDYTNDLFVSDTDNYSDDCDVVKVYNIYKTNNICNIDSLKNMFVNDNNLELIWERIIPEYTLAELKEMIGHDFRLKKE